MLRYLKRQNGQLDGQIDSQIDGQTARHIERQGIGQIAKERSREKTHRQKQDDGWTAAQTDRELSRWMERQEMDRLTDKQISREKRRINGWMDRQIDKWIIRHSNHLAGHQWIGSAIRDSTFPPSPPPPLLLQLHLTTTTPLHYNCTTPHYIQQLW